MTDPESITVDLAHAKELKAHGWPQEDVLYFWIQNGKGFDDWSESIMENAEAVHRLAGKGTWAWSKVVAAPTAEEILRRLPDSIQIARENRVGKEGRSR